MKELISKLMLIPMLMLMQSCMAPTEDDVKLNMAFAQDVQSGKPLSIEFPRNSEYKLVRDEVPDISGTRQYILKPKVCNDCTFTP